MDGLCILQEGENNDKFDTHPGSQAALPAYLITHNTLFYMLDLVASIGLLSLALFEPPHVPRLYMHIAVSPNLHLHIFIYCEIIVHTIILISLFKIICYLNLTI